MKLDWHHAPARTVIVRTPLFPFDTLLAWAAAGDPRAHLRALIEDPVIREALIVSSPELDAGIGDWLANPGDPELRRVEHSLVRYLSRMAGRPTPFGLMSSIGTGELGPTSSWVIGGRETAHRHVRIDGDYLTATCNALAALPEIRAGLRYTPSTSLYTAGGRLRYAEARAGALRSYHLVDVEPSDYLLALIERARAGATIAELIETLCLDPEVGTDDAEAFVHQLIDAQLLSSDLEPQVTGGEPAASVIERLRSIPAGEPYAAALEQLGSRLRAFEALPLGAPTSTYRALTTGLEPLPVEARLERLVQVDLHKDTALVVGKDVVDEVSRALALLHKIGGAGEDDPLGRFRGQFVGRYGNRDVPLVEVLDEESGIGFLQNPPPTAPLLEVEFPQRTDKKLTPWNRRDVHLLRLAQTAARRGDREIVLAPADETELAREHPAKLYSVLLVPIAVASTGLIRLMNADAPGIRMLGRFCHGSPAIAELVRELIPREEAERPDAVFAEVVHLPEGRIGNVLFRPQLRRYEIPFLGRSGAAPEWQLPISDLTVSVVGARVVIRSRRLAKEIIPRLTTAHAFTRYSLAVYRFLAGVAGQDGTFVGWNWGALADAPFTPRVRSGKVVVARARWKLGAADLEQVKTAKHAAVAALRTELGWPRWIALVEADNELPIDLDNPLAVDSFAKLIAGQDSAQLVEVFPAPDEVAVRGPDGGYAHELQLLYVRDQPAAPVPVPAVEEARVERVFSPGSEWLFLKYYCGFAVVDTVLREVAPIARELVANGVARSWFFIRFSDPDWHLRLRLAGAPAELLGRALPLLEERLRPLVDAGVIWKTQLETYERELERYGGAVGIGPSEELFAADSEAAATIIEAFQGDEGVRLMWRAALLGLDRLLDDLGLDFGAKRAFVTTMRDEFGGEVGMDTEFQRRLGDKFRKHRAEIEAALVALPDDELAPARAAFDRRSAALRDIVPRLRGLAIEKLAASYTHMHVNRMTAAGPRQQELVLYDMLRRYYEGVAARAKGKR